MDKKSKAKEAGRKVLDVSKRFKKTILLALIIISATILTLTGTIKPQMWIESLKLFLGI